MRLQAPLVVGSRHWWSSNVRLPAIFPPFVKGMDFGREMRNLDADSQYPHQRQRERHNHNAVKRNVSLWSARFQILLSYVYTTLTTDSWKD